LQTEIREHGKTLLIELMTTVSKSTFIIFDDQRENQLFSRDDSMLFLLYPVEVLIVRT